MWVDHSVAGTCCICSAWRRRLFCSLSLSVSAPVMSPPVSSRIGGWSPSNACIAWGATILLGGGCDPDFRLTVIVPLEGGIAP